MNYNTEKFRQGVDNLKLELTEKQIEQFLKYYEMLIEKNKVMNLTAITEYDEVIEKHFLDSLSLCKVMDLDTEISVLDMGTGTGVIPILLEAKTKGREFIGLEIQELSYDMAVRSVALNGL